METPFSWLWWWWYFDLENRNGPRLSSVWTRWTSQGGLVGAVSAALFGDYTRAFWLVLAIAVIGIALGRDRLLPVVLHSRPCDVL